MFIDNLKLKGLFVAGCGLLFSSFAIAEPISKLIDKAMWGVPNGPLELSGICHVATNEYACVSDSGGRVNSFFIDESQIDSQNYMPTAKDFVLLREGVGHDLEACVSVDDAMLCIDESTSSIKAYYPNKKDCISISLPVKNVVSNCGLESLAYFPKNKLFVTCTEHATHGAPKGEIKLIFFTLDLDSKKCNVKYEIPYKIDEFDGKNTYRNGVSELLAWDESTLLVVERAVDLQGRIPRSRIRIYAIDLRGIDKSLIDKGIAKQLVYEYESKIMPVNIEGICRIPNTNKLLVVHDLPGMCIIGILEADMPGN